MKSFFTSYIVLYDVNFLSSSLMIQLLSTLKENLIFLVLIQKRGVRGEFFESKHIKEFCISYFFHSRMHFFPCLTFQALFSIHH